MPDATLGQLIGRHGIDVLDHLDREADVPVLNGLQFQGDVAVIPDDGNSAAGLPLTDVPAQGMPLIEATGGGHEHRLLASAPGTARFTALTEVDIGVLMTDAPAYLAHPEHGYLGIAPGTYLLRRQREQADEERIVAD